MAIIKISGVELPSPTEYKVDLFDLDSENSSRSETGIMNRARIRSNVAKIQLGFANLTTTQLTSVVDAITPDEFTVDFFYGGWKTATMYAGDKNITLKSTTKPDDARWSLVFNLIEF